MQFGFSFDAFRCSGCMASMVACMDQHDLPGDGSAFRQVTRMEAGDYPDVSLAFFSIACFHCYETPCVAVCPANAISRDPDTGIVDVDAAACFGCHSCAMACPFGAPRFPDGKEMSKCDLCSDRVAYGMEPACVRTCPTRALGFGPMENLGRKKASKASIRILESLMVAGAEAG